MDKKRFHSLEGEHIYFKQVGLEDVKAMHQYISNEDVSRFIGWSLMTTQEETQEHIEIMLSRESAGTHLYAALALKSTQETIGNAMIFNFDVKANHAEVGYVLHKAHWGKGYGTECVRLMSEYGFGILKFHKLRACVADANIGSARILEKNGYELEGRLRDHYFIEGKYYDSLLYGKIQAK